MKIGYFPGCSLLGTAVEYATSLEEVLKVFGMELEEIKDWNCCGATAAHNLNHTLALALPARSLALAEKQGFEEFLTPCAACFNRLYSAYDSIKKDVALRKKIENIIEMPLAGTAKPISVIEFLNKRILPELPSKVVSKFEKKTACYYGCLLVRPKELMQFERFEDPMALENIMKALGAQPIDWGYKTECCGASLSIARTDIVGALSGKILGDAIHRGAEAIVVACPMCQSNLDMRRPEINAYLKTNSEVPVIYITQAIGMALGLESSKLGLGKHFVDAQSLISINKNKAAILDGVPAQNGKEA